MSAPARLEYDLPAKMENLPGVIEAVADLAAGHGFSPARGQMIELALEEALVNIVKHAYENTPGRMRITGHAREDGLLEVTLVDQGPAFDLRTQPAPDLSLDVAQRSIGGLGIHFIRRVTDRIEYQRADGENRLSLLFRPTTGQALQS